jgi:diguanylate cyclase (GGDEF)-like protein
MRLFVLGFDMLAVLVSLALFLHPHVTGAALARLGLLVGLSIAFEEISSRVEYLRVRLRIDHRHNDMTSVWTFAGAIVLPPSLLVPLVGAIRLHMWFRHQRHSGMQPYRQVFTAVTILFACLSAHAILGAVAGSGHALPHGLLAVLGVSVAILAYTVTNTGLIYIAVRLATRPEPSPSFLSQINDNALEVATLCLAGLTALALLYQPWLTVLVFPAMVVLQRSVLTRELEIAATTDSKTGLLNAFTWRQMVERELDRADRTGSAQAMLIIDMDNFKLINDAHGHLVGDAVLKAVADALTEELRGYDMVGRFGGEEFVALLSDVDAPTALAISQRILERIRSIEVPTRTEAVVSGLSASIGISCYPTQATAVDDLLHAADAALYAAKRAGRDQVQYERTGPA